MIWSMYQRFLNLLYLQMTQTYFVLSSKDNVSLSVTICNELMKLKKWFALNKLSLNITLEDKLHDFL